MKEKNKLFVLLFALLMGYSNVGKAQIEKMANYVFTNDSLAGFDEPAASAGALANSCFGREYKVYMYKAKRRYIKQKYQLKENPAAPFTIFKNPVYGNKTLSVGGGCDNEDFELATANIVAPNAVQGWTVQSGSNPNSCFPPTINGNNNYTVFASSTLDDKTGLLISSYFAASNNSTPAGNCFIRLNDATAGAKASLLTKSFIVTPSNSLFEYAYLPVIEAAPHDCCDQPGFNIHITVTNTATSSFTVLACPQISVAVPGALCSYTPAPGDPVFVNAITPGWVYYNWAASAIDLTQYIGYQVTFNIVVVDCDQGGHAGYAYFDSKCAPMTILGNNNPFPAGTPSITLPTCGLNSATICAPAGLGPYTWSGPGIFAPYNVPSMSNQCFTTGISATYTLTMNPPGSCNPIDRVVTVTITPSPYLLASVIQATCGGTQAKVSYTAAGSASVNPVITWSPVPTATTTNGQNLGTGTFPVGTGIVTITAQDPLGCVAVATVNINSPPPQPTVAIINVTGSPSITCSTPSIVLQGVSGYTYGTLDYFWSANSFTGNTQSFTVNLASSVITLYATDPISQCVATATASIKVNTVAPTSSVTPVNQNINCAAGAIATATGIAISPTTNVTHMWYSSANPNNPTSSGGQVSIFAPTPGCNTFVLVDNVNGCSTTKTIQVTSTGGAFPTFSMNSSQNYSIGCSTTSLTNVQVLFAQAGSGGVVSYTMLPPGYAGGTSYSTSTSLSTFTINSPGNYTVIVKDNSNLCETRVPVSIIQNTFVPDISAGAVTLTLSCFTPSVLLIGNSANSAQGPVDFNWAFQGNPGNSPSYTVAVNTNSAAASSSIINVYTLTATEENNACINTTVVTMYQNTRPPLPSIGTVTNALTCSTNSLNLTNASLTGILLNTFTTYSALVSSWKGPTPQLPDSGKSSYPAYTPGTYTMTVQDLNNGCISSTTTVILDDRVFPVLIANQNVALDCNQATTGGVKLPVIAQGLTSSQVTAQWIVPQPPPNISGANSLTLTTDGPGEYKLVVSTKSNNCTSAVSVNVTNGILNAEFTPDKESGFAPLTVNFTNGSSSTSSVSGTSSITSVWSFGNGTTRTTTTNVSTSAVYTAPGTYTVIMFSSKGSCKDTVIKVITVDIPSSLVVPNVFTPNGDNSNDIFFLRTANLTQITIQIFDRWGDKVYELSSSTGNIAWDGKNQSGHEAPDGTYLYTIKASGKDGQSYDTKGTVSLYR